MQASSTVNRLRADSASVGSTLRFFRSGGAPTLSGSPADLRFRFGGADACAAAAEDSASSTVASRPSLPLKDTLMSRRHIGGRLRKVFMAGVSHPEARFLPIRVQNVR